MTSREQALTTSRARRTSFAFVAPAVTAARCADDSDDAHAQTLADDGDGKCDVSLPLTSSSVAMLMSSMDATQREVACFAIDKPLLVQAGAGSGKTQTMAMRIAVLLLSGVPARAILGICFTRQAAETLRERVCAVLPRELRAAASALKLKTMHAFGLECLRRFGRIDVQTPVYDAAQQRRLAARVVAAHAIHTRSADAVDELVEFVNRAKTRAHAPHIEVNPELQAAYLYRYYEQALHDDCHAVDFGDLLQLFLAMLRTTRAATTTTTTTNDATTAARGAPRVTVASRECVALRATYTHLVVDEFQDLNEVQLEVLAMLAGDACRVTCVGDPNQCIYAWRGAVPAVFALWRRRFPQTALRTLGVNYRSTAAIVAATNVVARTQQRALHGDDDNSNNNNNNNNNNSNTSTASTRRPLLVECDTDAEELRALVLLLKRVLPQRDARYAATLDDVAVLCRTRRRVQLLCSGLRAAGVSACEHKRVTPDGITCVRGLLAYVRLCVAPHVDADVQLALTCGALRLSSKAAKELFFSLDATQRDVRSNNNNNTTGQCVSYFELLRQLVYDNFAHERYPKLQMCKAAQKVVRSFVRVLTHAHDTLSRTPCDVPALLRYVVREAGFERMSHTLAATAARRPQGGLSTAHVNDRSTAGKRGREAAAAVAVSTGAALAAAVAAEVSSSAAAASDDGVCCAHTTDAQQLQQQCKHGDDDDKVTVRRRVDAAGVSSSSSRSHRGGSAGGCDEHEQQTYTPDEEAALLSQAAQQSLCELLLQAYETVSSDATETTAATKDAAAATTPAMLLLRRVVDELTTLLPSDNFGPLRFATASHSTDNDTTTTATTTTTKGGGSVTVTTVHQAKGMEWAAVILPGCWAGEYPVRAGSDEERRVFYVGMSRARRDLVLVTAKRDARGDNNDNGGGGSCAVAAVCDGRTTADATTNATATATSESGVGATLQRTPYLDMIEHRLEHVRYRDLHAQYAAAA